MKELIYIQSDLKAPKEQYNNFGGYKYRSCEDILEAVKPLLAAHKCVLTLSDDITLIGERYYVKSTAKITNSSGEFETCMALAREDLAKKGMDGAQITGTSSSYARKYALNGLFCIDDTKDSDTDERRIENEKRSSYQSSKEIKQTGGTENSNKCKTRTKITMDHLDNVITCDQLLKWMYGFFTTEKYSPDFDPSERLLRSYDADQEVVTRFSSLFKSYCEANKKK